MKKLLLALLLLACHRSGEPDLGTFTRGMEEYLQARGDLCLGKPSWPVEVTARDRAAGARDALQMPVLRRLGVVAVDEVDGVQRYHLTDLGMRSYRESRGDFCAARLTLDRVVGWEANGRDRYDHATVRYTYRVAAAPWMADAQARRVFPAVERVIRGAGRAELTQDFVRVQSRWVARELAPGLANRP
jgi:hypothetical protein